MAKQVQTKQKPQGSRKLIAALTLVVALVLTAVFLFFGVTGRNMDAQGLYKLLPWLPIPTEGTLWRQALVPGASLGDTQVLTFTGANEDTEANKDLETTVQVLSKRLNDLGFVDAGVEVKNGQVQVTLPGAANLQEAEKLLSQQGKYSFADPQGQVFLDGDAVVSSGFGYADNSGTNFALSVEFDSKGKQVFSDKSRELIGQSISILRDGVILVSPSISEPLVEGRVSIPGFTLEDARDNAILLRSGPLPYALTLVSPAQQDSSLYGDNVQSMLVIALYTFALLVLLYFVFAHRLAGLTAAWMLLLQLALGFFLAALIRSGFTVMTLWAVFASFVVTAFGFQNLLLGLQDDLARGRSVRQSLKDSYAGRGHISLDVFAALILINVVLIIADAGLIRIFAQIFALGLLAGLLVLHLLYRLVLNEVIHLAGGSTTLYAAKVAARKEA